jgi:chromosomal replication initiator protein
MNNQQLWQAILGNLEVSLSRANFNTWFKNTTIVERGESHIIVGVPTAFTQDWISKKYHQDLLKALKNIAPEIREIKYQVGQQPKEGSTTPPSMERPAVKAPAAPSVSQHPANVHAATAISGNLNPKYTFETFVIGKNNELAHAASVAVAKNPGSQYNPLFIYGGVGLGKTHLMHAVGCKLLHDNPAAKVLYVTSEKFTNGYISAIQNKRMEAFKHQYRTVDMLLIDDIQFLSNKEGTQEEFFHTFNELRDRGKQIILTSDRLPKEIPAIEQRLVSRFEWGMVADIQPPDLETRLAILRKKLAKLGFELNEDVLYYIAENVISNIRELEGVLNGLVVYKQMGRPITTEQAEKIIAGMVNSKKKILSLKKIAQSVAEFYHISEDDLLKQSRRKEYVNPRQIAMYLARKEMKSSFPAIGEYFGGRDHTTVMHGVEKVEKMVGSIPNMKQEVNLIMDKLYTT